MTGPCSRNTLLQLVTAIYLRSSVMIVIQRINYDYWAKEVLLAAADRSDKESFSRFVLDLPELSEGLFDLVRDLAADKARYVCHTVYLVVT